MTNHTILLIQRRDNAERRFQDFDTLHHAVEAIVQMFEDDLKGKNKQRQISYKESDLYQYVQSHQDFVLLLYNPQISAYVPHDKAYIEQRLHDFLAQRANAQTHQAQHSSLLSKIKQPTPTTVAAAPQPSRPKQASSAPSRNSNGVSVLSRLGRTTPYAGAQAARNGDRSNTSGGPMRRKQTQ
ncbi:hypothetical protein RI367_004365 [Sorochytrium milnesiophthora]